MIAFLVAAVLAAATMPAPAPSDVPPIRSIVTPELVLSRYAAALAANVAPHVVSFEYVLEQTGARDLLQSHRVFRSGTDQRDEILAVDGHKLDPPVVRITHGHGDRYAVAALAPKPSEYALHYVGTERDGHHPVYVFTAVRHAAGPYRVTDVTIDGITFLPASISFETDAHGGSGTIVFARQDAYWVPSLATARATYAKLAARERITFAKYRFPPSLPPSTFAKPHPMPTIKLPSS